MLLARATVRSVKRLLWFAVVLVALAFAAVSVAASGHRVSARLTTRVEVPKPVKTTKKAVGAFGGYSETGPFFNVQTETLDMHLLPAEIAAIYAVEKQGHDSEDRSGVPADERGDHAERVDEAVAPRTAEE